MKETKNNNHIESISNNLMINNLYIFGSKYDNRSNQTIDTPNLLCAYPSTGDSKSSKELNQIATFCFPNEFRKLNDNSSKKIILDQFAFYVKKSNRNIFATCVQFKVPNDSNPFFATNQNRCYPFAICTFSNYPCISHQIRFLTHLIYILLGKEHPQRRFQKIPLFSNVRGLCHPSLVFDKRFMCVSVCEGMQVPQIFVEQIFLFQNEANNYHVPMISSKQLLHQTIHTLLSFITVSNLIKLYTAVLLEKRILFLSKSASKYSSAVIGLNALTEMFCTSTIIMPVVPSQYNVLLENPIAYIAGSSKSNDNADLIYDLDIEELCENTDIPHLPSHNELQNKLEKFLEYEKEEIVIPNEINKSFLFGDKINPKFIEFVKNLGNGALPICKISDLKIAIKSELTDLIQNIFDEHVSSRIMEFINSYKKMALFKEGVRSSSEALFYDEFISTQGGSMFVDDIKKLVI